MDEDTASLLIVGSMAVLFLMSPLIIILSVTTCIARNKTREWQREKLALHQDPETINTETKTLLENNNTDEDAEADSDLDPEDSDDEIEIRAREEKHKDMQLTPKQKFRKEWAKAWKGDKEGRELEEKRKERAERRKLAKAVVKELARMEKRNARKAMIQSQNGGLPEYKQ